MLAPEPIGLHRRPPQRLIHVNESPSASLLFAKVRRDILAARSRELPWEYRVEWARKGATPYPPFTTGRAESELLAVQTAQILLRNMTEGADPRAVAAWIKGPGDDEFRRVPI